MVQHLLKNLYGSDQIESIGDSLIDSHTDLHSVDEGDLSLLVDLSPPFQSSHGHEQARGSPLVKVVVWASQ